MVLANVVKVDLIPSDGGFLDLLFHHSWINVNLLGLFDKQGGFLLTLSGFRRTAARQSYGAFRASPPERGPMADVRSGDPG